MNKWDIISKKMQQNYKTIFSNEESFGIWVELDDGRKQNVGFVLQGLLKRQFIHIESVICEVQDVEIEKVVRMATGLWIGGIIISENYINLHHSIALETLDDEISPYTSFDTLIFATIYLATQADNLQKELKLKGDKY
jgi:hypothetical protein